MSDNGDGEHLLVSYLTLRKVIGVLGVALPVLVSTGAAILSGTPELRPSISDYYGSEMRDVFVGILFAIGWFLFSYRGYERRDDIAGDLACVFALGVALFPTTSTTGWIRAIHFLSAALLFSVLAYFSIVLFRKTKPGVPPTPRKLMRNRVYLGCGLIMLGCIAAIVLYKLLLDDTGLAALKPVFWLEALALWAFGFSWFVKGEAILADR